LAVVFVPGRNPDQEQEPLTEEQQQTTTPEPAAQDAPVEAAEAAAIADPALAVVEEMAAVEAAEELADEAIVADAVAEGLVVEALEAAEESEELAAEAVVADVVAEELVEEAVVAEAASEELADEAVTAQEAGDGDAAEELAAESYAAEETAEELVAEAVVAQDAAEELAAESYAADEVSAELVAEAVAVEATAVELAEEAIAAEAVADDLAAVIAEEVAHAPAAEPVAPLGPEPSTMAELLAEQDADIRSFKHGDVVEGTVVRIDRDEILVDIGAKSEGVVSNRELYGRNAESAPTLAIGDTVLVYVLQPESPEGHVVLSLRRAGLERKWRSMQEQFETGVIIEAPVIDHNKGGLIVDCGIRGFVPISQIVDFPRRPQNEQPRDAAQEIAEKLQPYVGRRLRLKILEVNRKANRLILSEKVALYEERREKRDELFSSLQVGQKVTGSVRSIAPFGVFIDLGGIDGLVHKSELSWNKVNNPEAGYKVGDEVEAEVIDINHERGRISLSIRRLQPDPWHSTVADFRVGDVIEGTVTKLVNFGAFVRVRDGLEGLIHISELSHQRVAHPGDVVREGQTLKLKIISLDSERHRLGLSLKQAEEPPARPAPEARPRRERPERGYSVGDAVQEPEGGIDNTLAAAFAQVRQQLEAAEAAEAATPEPVAEAVAEEAVAEAEEAEAVAEEAVAEAMIAEVVAEEAVAEADVAEAVAEEAVATAKDEVVAEEAVAEAYVAEAVAEEAVAEADVAEAVAEEAVAEAEEAEAVAEEAIAEAYEADKA
jgi:small subunit ribosomal protein S1